MANAELTNVNVQIHPTALVESDRVGPGTRIWAWVHVMAGAEVGRDCSIGDSCFLESGVVVGDGVTIKNCVHLWEGVTIEDGVFVGPGTMFTNDSYPRSRRFQEGSDRYRDANWLRPTLVRNGASIGASAIILPGVTLGEYCMVGAGALVTRDVAPHRLVVGSPAREVGWVCACGRPLKIADGGARCDFCGRSYTLESRVLRLDPN